MKKRVVVALKISAMFCAICLIGCASKIPEISRVDHGYSAASVKNYSVKMNCSEIKTSGLQSGFAAEYCKMLSIDIKMALQNTHMSWHEDAEKPDIIVETEIEQLHGGSAAARFWVGFGAGRTVITAYVKVFMGGRIVAERRINETTTMPDLVSETWSNEDAINRDAWLIAKKIAQFVVDPVGYGVDQSSEMSR